MHLIVGLGNPGSEYEGTRHNAGFMAADRFRVTRELGRTRRRYQGRWCEGRVCGRDVALLMPHTYMNNSGEAVRAAAVRKHISPEEIIVIHDDMDFPFGTVRVRAGGGTGGHKGLESIAALLGTTGFARVRIGIGRPENPFIAARDWVLSDMGVSGDELAAVLDTAADCVEAIIIDGMEAAMTRFNRRNDDKV